MCSRCQSPAEVKVSDWASASIEYDEVSAITQTDRPINTPSTKNHASSRVASRHKAFELNLNDADLSKFVKLDKCMQLSLTSRK